MSRNRRSRRAAKPYTSLRRRVTELESHRGLADDADRREARATREILNRLSDAELDSLEHGDCESRLSAWAEIVDREAEVLARPVVQPGQRARGARLQARAQVDPGEGGSYG